MSKLLANPSVADFPSDSVCIGRSASRGAGWAGTCTSRDGSAHRGWEVPRGTGTYRNRCCEVTIGTMATDVPTHVIDVQDFERDVIARSAEVPVLVDFWAPWCGPCRMLGPVLEKLASEMEGAIVLAKVNVEENQPVAARYQVSGIPDVKLFADGEVVGGFVGAQPEAHVRAFLRQHMPSEADNLLGAGRRLVENGDIDGARAAFEQALAIDPTCDAAHLDLARLALGRGDLEAARDHAGRISPTAKEAEMADHVAHTIDLVAQARDFGDEDAVRAHLATDPDDVAAHFALGGHRLARAAFRDALDAFFAVAERDRKWHDEAARKAMLTVFGLIGVRNPLSDEYRRKLMLVY